MFIDHVTVAGRNLDELRTQLMDAGICTEYGGVHGNGVTHMALAGFADSSYLELVAPLDREGRVMLWHNFQLPRAGGTAWTVAADDVGSELERVRGLGLEAEGPVVIRREKPDGQIGQWELGYLAGPQPGGTLPFVIRDYTDRSLRVRPTPRLKTMLRGWSAIILAVHEIRAAAGQFQRAYDWPAPVAANGMHHFRGTPVYLASPADHLEEFGESPCACVLRAENTTSVASLRSSRTSTLAGRLVHWLDLPWRNLHIGVEN